ncbi:GNAT family N-acetyltransferase [Myceligenerans xiligouense]|uniref:GNAT family N-acetyltransferase n=1 Tax=Myceligenerans xiligouense TaxID=253184 RepID=UPI001FEA48F1|nr:GNAT family N-acetyltransferase [Myceligenerans xiligouense]
MTFTPSTTESSQSRLDHLSWPFRTERLTIRRCTTGDLDPLWKYRGLPEVSRWTSWHPADRQDWNRYQGEPARMARTLVFEHDGAIAGDLMLMVHDGWAQREAAARAHGTQAELGWALDPTFGGRGLATEAVRELIRISFEELGLRRVSAGAFADNERSVRVMERVGMRREAYKVKESFHRDLGWLDGIEYALLADEWGTTA